MFTVDNKLISRLEKIDSYKTAEEKWDAIQELLLTTPLHYIPSSHSVFEIDLLSSIYFAEDLTRYKEIIPDDTALPLIKKILSECYRPVCTDIHIDFKSKKFASSNVLMIPEDDAKDLDPEKCIKGILYRNFLNRTPFVFYCPEGLGGPKRCTDKDEMIEFIKNIKTCCVNGPEFPGYDYEVTDLTKDHDPIAKRFVQYIDFDVDCDGQYLNDYPIMLAMSEELKGDIDILKAMYKYQPDQAGGILCSFVRIHNKPLFDECTGYWTETCAKFEKWVNETYGLSLGNNSSLEIDSEDITNET